MSATLFPPLHDGHMLALQLREWRSAGVGDHVDSGSGFA